MPKPVVVVTDSAAMLPPDVAEEGRVVVMPLQVIIGDEAYDEGTPEASPAAVAAALTAKHRVSTSRPAPAAFGELYRRLADEGAEEIVSVHLSGDMSGTLESAQVAARTAPVPVTAVDTRTVGPCQGLAALAAAAAVRDGRTAAQAAAAARAQAEASTSYFYVDTLEHLRRGGRIGAAAALLGAALAVKPLLAVEDGRVMPRERVRTAGRALARLEDLAVEAAGEREVDVCVAHLAAEDRARALAERLADRLGDRLGGQEVRCGELPAVLGAHVGPGMLAVAVAPALAR